MAVKNKIQIITDSTTSLSAKECEEYGLDYVETSFVLDGVEHKAFDDDGLGLTDFYAKLDNIKSCSTCCVNQNTFEEIFEKYVSRGEQVLYTGLSASLSSTFSNAEIVAKQINQKYGKKMVAVVDSRSASYGTLVLIDYAKEFIAGGEGLEEIETKLNEIAKSMSVAFVSRDLTFLHKCGRIGSIEAGIGKLLHIVPIVYVSESGKLKTGDKCLGVKLALKTLKNKFGNYIRNKHHKRCYITSCGMDEDVEMLKKYFSENTDIEQIKTGLIDKTLACCCGPKTIAVFCG